jgi:hypothetical protein
LQPITQVLLEIPKALQDELITDSGLKLYIDPSFRKEWQSSVTAKILALPLKSSGGDKKIISKLNIGDEVAISYRVVADFHFQGDGKRFMAASKGSDYLQTFYNGAGEKIEIIAFPGPISPIWVGYYMNKKGELIDGTQGSQSDVERWQSQFPFGKTDIYTFNNFFEHDGKQYWKCDPSDIYAKKVGGKLVSVGDRVIGLPVDENVPREILQNIEHTGKEVKIRHQDRLSALTGGEEKGIKKRDIVSFPNGLVEKYEFWGRQYYIISERLINGRWQKTKPKPFLFSLS